MLLQPIFNLDEKKNNDKNSSHDQGESKLNIAINANSDAHTHDKITTSSFNKNNVARAYRKNGTQYLQRIQDPGPYEDPGPYVNRGPYDGPGP